MTRKEKIASERRRQKELERVEASNRNRAKDGQVTTDEKFLLKGKVKYGERNVGAFDSIKKQNTTELKNKNGDLKFIDYGSGLGDKSKRSKLIEERTLAKEYRKNKRAEKLGEKRGLSDQQAKDFMQNRRDRFKQRTGEYLRGLGLSENIIGKGNGVDDRLYRKDGSGTLQNMKRKDGSTYDATKGFGKGKGGTRDEVDQYFDIIQPNREKDLPSEEVKQAKGLVENPTPEEAIKAKVEKDVNDLLRPELGLTEAYKPKIVDVSMPVTDQLNSTLSLDMLTPNQQNLRAQNNEAMNRSIKGIPNRPADAISNYTNNLQKRIGAFARNNALRRLAGR